MNGALSVLLCFGMGQAGQQEPGCLIDRMPIVQAFTRGVLANWLVRSTAARPKTFRLGARSDFEQSLPCRRSASQSGKLLPRLPCLARLLECSCQSLLLWPWGWSTQVGMSAFALASLVA